MLIEGEEEEEEDEEEKKKINERTRGKNRYSEEPGKRGGEKKRDH